MDNYLLIFLNNKRFYNFDIIFQEFLSLEIV